MKRLSCCRGQSLIETLALAMALMVFLSVLGGVFYFSLVHTGMNYLLHEHLVCEQTQHESRCERQFRDRAKAWLFAAKIESFHTQKIFSKRKTEVVLAMPFRRRLTVRKEMETL